jgi:hypothetical protein
VENKRRKGIEVNKFHTHYALFNKSYSSGTNGNCCARFVAIYFHLITSDVEVCGVTLVLHFPGFNGKRP